MFFVQISTRPPNTHLKLTEYGRFCKQNNQLPTKSHDVLEDNSNMFRNLPNHRFKEQKTTYQLLCLISTFVLALQYPPLTIVEKSLQHKYSQICNNRYIH